MTATGHRSGRAWRALVSGLDASPLRRWSEAVSIVALALVASLLLGEELSPYGVVAALLATGLCALRAGMGPGSLVLLACAVARVMGARAGPGHRWFEPGGLHGLVLFLALGAIGVWGGGALRELYRAAQAATRARDEVLAVVSHDLKTPLGALLVGARLVERSAPATPDADDLRKAARLVLRTAERMGRLVHDLVDVASLEAGRLSIHPAALDAAQVVHEALEAVRVLGREREVEVVAEAPAPVPLRCDRDRLNQVLVNLLSNAVHATPPGGRVVARAVASAGEGLITVTDSGPGIAAEDLPRLFERWFRGRRASYPGSGMGLAISSAIVEAHGGRIWADSEEGKGCTFAVALPLRREGGGAPAASSPVERR